MVHHAEHLAPPQRRALGVSRPLLTHIGLPALKALATIVIFSQTDRHPPRRLPHAEHLALAPPQHKPPAPPPRPVDPHGKRTRPSLSSLRQTDIHHARSTTQNRLGTTPQRLHRSNCPPHDQSTIAEPIVPPTRRSRLVSQLPCSIETNRHPDLPDSDRALASTYSHGAGIRCFRRPARTRECRSAVHRTLLPALCARRPAPLRRPAARRSPDAGRRARASARRALARSRRRSCVQKGGRDVSASRLVEEGGFLHARAEPSA